MIESWREFAESVRSRRDDLLREVGRFPGAILVTGCQRSGTTMLSRLLMHAPGFVPYRLTHDNELDAALLLSGAYHKPMPAGRYCFQTTYLNNCWREYARLGAQHRVVWVLRRPDSVVWSMVYHWKPFARQELYRACGLEVEAGHLHVYQSANRWQQWRYRDTWRACMAYIGKTHQLDDVHVLLGDRLKVVDYDDLVSDPANTLPPLYDWLGVPFDVAAIKDVKASSLSRAVALKPLERQWVTALCQPVYDDMRDRYLS
ncbi:MAG: sulfotransferase [Gammaproteobacteria bacterium]|nr:MAG: sulfotransferase [Gammaproteobacteria bacterium]